MRSPEKPKGELVIRTIAMPADTNPNGDVFGGWLMSQMDLGSGILASKTAKARVVTVAMEGLSFLQPVGVGDTVTCYAWVEEIGRTSMTIPVEVWVERFREHGRQILVTRGVFVYVALDDAGRPIPVQRERQLVFGCGWFGARGSGFGSSAGRDCWLAFHAWRLNFRRTGELLLQLHPVVTGMPNITGIRSLLPSVGGKVGTTALSQRD